MRSNIKTIIGGGILLMLLVFGFINPKQAHAF